MAAEASPSRIALFRASTAASFLQVLDLLRSTLLSGFKSGVAERRVGAGVGLVQLRGRESAQHGLFVAAERREGLCARADAIKGG